MPYSHYVENLFVNRQFINPYSRIDPNYITSIIFYDARTVDSGAPAGFRLQRKEARKNYLRWLKNVRSQPGWQNFRRRTTEDN